MNYYKAPENWTPSAPNPFSKDGGYGPEWTCFHIDGVNRKNNCSGGGRKGLFIFSVGTDTPCLDSMLADFLRYERKCKRNSIIWCDDPLFDLAPMVEQALTKTPEGNCVRSADPKYVIHSTPFAAWRGISQDSMLKSLSLLHEEGKKAIGLGIEELGDPPDYADYIVFGPMGSVGAEIVVASREKGRIVSDPDQAYEPGVRIYFDNHRIIRNGLAVRDGLHFVKVHRSLPLAPYMVAAITARDFPEQIWSPRTFSKAADDLFLLKKENDRDLK